MIRTAKFGDIPEIVAIMGEAHRGSIYAHLTFDEAEAKRILLTAIQRNMGSTEGGAFVAVATDGAGAVTAFMVAILSRLYHVAAELVAQDLFLVATERAGPRDAMKLVRAMKKWAWSAPGCVQVEIGATKIMGLDPDVTGRWLRQSGMEPYGRIYRQERPA